jgi:hypothetical protein
MKMSQKTRAELETVVGVLDGVEDDVVAACEHCRNAMNALTGPGTEPCEQPKIASLIGMLTTVLPTLGFVRQDVQQGRNQFLQELRG